MADFALPPGIGNPQQAMQATAFMRQQPWYQSLIKSWGLNPAGDANGNPGKLTEDEQQQLLDTARKNGIGISDRYAIDENGQIAEPESHWLRNSLIAAGIGGSLFIPGVTEAIMAGLGGGAGAGAGAAATEAGAGAGEGLLASTPLSAGLFTAPTVAASGAIPAAAATAAGGSTGLISDIASILGPASKIATPLADVLGGAAKNAQGQNNTADQLKLALYNAQQNAQLGAKKFALSAPSARMRTALSAMLPQYDTPTKVNWGGPGSGLRGEIPTFTGGPADAVRAASNSPQYQQLSHQVMNDELLSQMEGGASGGNQDVSVGTPPPVGQSSTGDNILGGAALGTSLLGALGKLGLFTNKNAMQPGTDWNPEMG